MKHPETISEMWMPDRGGMMLFRCKDCGGEFPEPFSNSFAAFKLCPHCGVRFLDSTVGILTVGK